jgi:hypothetical protein
LFLAIRQFALYAFWVEMLAGVTYDRIDDEGLALPRR